MLVVHLPLGGGLAPIYLIRCFRFAMKLSTLELCTASTTVMFTAPDVSKTTKTTQLRQNFLLNISDFLPALIRFTLATVAVLGYSRVLCLRPVLFFFFKQIPRPQFPPLSPRSSPSQ